MPERLGARSREAQMTTARSAAVLAAAACLAVLTAGCASHAACSGPAAPARRAPHRPRTISGGHVSRPRQHRPRQRRPRPRPAAGLRRRAVHQPAVPRLHRLERRLGRAAGDESILTNHSGTTCHVYGYPGLAFFDGLPMATHLTWVKEPRATVVLRPGGNAQALLTWRANTATGPAPFNPDIVHVTPPDEHAYLRAVWPGGPVRDGNIAAWPLRAAPAGPSRPVPAPSPAPSTACA